MQMHRIEEQPGDCTRYAHLIEFDGVVVYVYKDIVKNGAGLRVNRYFNLYDVMEVVHKWVQDEIYDDPYKCSAELIEMAEELNENAFTLGSVFRCIYRLKREEA